MRNEMAIGVMDQRSTTISERTLAQISVYLRPCPLPSAFDGFILLKFNISVQTTETINENRPLFRRQC